MRAFIAIALASLLAVVGPSSAQMTLTGAGGTKKASAAGCSDTNATAWVNAVVAASGTVSAPQQTRVCNLIVAAKGHGYWTKLDRMWLLASENAAQAKIDIVNLATTTITGAPTFTASQGYSNFTTSDFIDTGYLPSSSSVHLTLNSVDIGYYNRTNRSASASVVQFGIIDATVTPTTRLLVASNAFGFDQASLNDAGGPSVASTNAQGLFIGVRDSVSTSEVYKDGNTTPIATGSAASNTLSTSATLFIGCVNTSTACAFPTTDQIAIAFVGGALTASDTANLSTDVNGGYMTSLGTNVY